MILSVTLSPTLSQQTSGRRQPAPLNFILFVGGTHLLDIAGAEDTVARVDRHEEVSEDHRDDGHQLHHLF